MSPDVVMKYLRQEKGINVIHDRGIVMGEIVFINDALKGFQNAVSYLFEATESDVAACTNNM